MHDFESIQNLQRQFYKRIDDKMMMRQSILKTNFFQSLESHLEECQRAWKLSNARRTLPKFISSITAVKRKQIERYIRDPNKFSNDRPQMSIAYKSPVKIQCWNLGKVIEEARCLIFSRDEIIKNKLVEKLETVLITCFVLCA